MNNSPPKADPRLACKNSHDAVACEALMSVRLIERGPRMRQLARWADVWRPDRTLADDISLTINGLARRDDVQVMMGSTLLGQRLGKAIFGE